MLDIKYVRDHLDEVQTMLEHRCNPLKLDGFKELEKKRRELLNETEQLKGKRNAVSKEISVMKKNGEDADGMVKEMRAVGEKISALDAELKEIESQLQNSFEREVTSVQIGELALAKLKDIDEIAYVRFASVYRDFNDIESFMEALHSLKNDK